MPWYIMLLAAELLRDLCNYVETLYREMEQIVKQLEGKEDVLKLVHTWYKQDDNCVPPEYVLQPISSEIPQYETETGYIDYSSIS